MAHTLPVFQAYMYLTTYLACRDIFLSRDHLQTSDKQKISPIRGLTAESLQLTSVPTSKSHETKPRPNIKNLARSNLDIVP